MISHQMNNNDFSKNYFLQITYLAFFQSYFVLWVFLNMLRQQVSMFSILNCSDMCKKKYLNDLAQETTSKEWINIFCASKRIQSQLNLSWLNEGDYLSQQIFYIYWIKSISENIIYLMSITLKAFQEFQDIGYTQDTALRQFQLNKALDRICKKYLGSAAQFDRDLSQQVWDGTQKDDQGRAIVRNIIQTLQRKKFLKFLFFKPSSSSQEEPNISQSSQNSLNKQSVSRPLNESLKDSVDPIDHKKQQNMKRDSINYENIRQSELSILIENPKMKKDMSYWKKFSICSTVCLTISIIMVFIMPPFINYMIKKTAIQKAILSHENQGFWAHFPGDSKTIITRNWTFFNITNSQDMLLYGQKPKFRQISGFKIQQLQDYLNITYIEGGERVRMIDWLHFNQFQGSRNLDQKVNIINVGGLGYWYNLKLARPTLLLQQGLALIFTTLEDSILQTVYAQGINAQFLSTSAIAQGIYTNAEVPTQNWVFLWQDDAYGMQDKNNLRLWVSAALNSKKQGQYSEEANYLRDYFTLSDSQIGQILDTFAQYCDALETLLIKNTFCPDIPLENCTGRYLAYKQMAQSFVTMNPPPNTVNATYTICQDNVTCHGYFPQIYAFYKKVYLPKHPEADKNLIFDPQMVKKWVDYDNSIQKNLTYNTAQNCLFHIGNLDALWQNGTLSDKSQNKQSNQNLQNIKVRFGLPSPQHTLVFWEWIKYLTNSLILQQNTNEQVGISTLFTKGLYQSFSKLQQNLQTFLLIKLIQKDINGVNHNCQDFINKTFEIPIGSKAIRSICDYYGHEVGTQKFVRDMINTCKSPFQSTWNNLKNFTQAKKLESMCDPESAPQTFGFYYNKQRIVLNQKYNCTITPYQYCSDYQLAAKQWATSAITMDPPEGIQLKSVQSFGLWDSSVDKFQYFYYRSKFLNDSSFPQLDTQKAYSLLNFDNWFSSSVVLQIFANKQTPKSLKDYMRYVSILSGLNGFTTQRSARELMFGYKDQILEEVKNAYPPFGGDPSTPSLVAFNDPNITKEQANLQLQWNTGKTDHTLLAQYRKINKLNYINIPKQSFNGNRTSTSLISPWIGQDYFYGTSAKQFAPNQFQTNNISLYVPNLQRYGSGTSKDTFPYQRYGFDLWIAYLGESIFQSTSESDINAKYYQSFFGIFNETSVVGLPLFVNKNHFMNCTSNWSSFIEIYNEDQSIKYEKTSHWDDSFVIIQPYSGVSFQSAIYLQSNYFHEPDQLVTYPQASMLPIFSLYRSGNITQDAVDNLFGPLLVGLAAIDWVRYTGVAFLVMSAGVLLYSINKRKKVQKDLKDSILQTKIKTSGLEISMQQEQKDQIKKEKDQLRQILLED